MALLLLVFGTSLVAGFGYHAIATIDRELPRDLEALREPPSKATRVYSADGELIGEFFLQRRVVVPLERIPEHVRQAFVAAEDRRFWEHPGFDPLGIVRAGISNFQGSGSKQGASTITQQLTRMLMLSNERTYYRKMKELVLSVRVERELSKRDILEMYLNRVYLGHGAHGVQAAADAYFGKDVDHLTIAEAALLAGLVQRPSDYSPHRNLPAARGRQRYVLARLLEDGAISSSQRDAALSEPISLIDGELPLNHVAAPYFVEHVRRWAEQRFGHRSVYDGGLRIYTTLDTRMQRSAEAAVRDGLQELDRRIGFRGPLGQLDGAALEAFRTEPPRPYLPGLDSAALGSGAEVLPEVAYVGAVAELPRRGGVEVAIGTRVLPMARDDARSLRAWRGEPDEHSRQRPEIAVGDLVPVVLTTDERGREVLALSQASDVQAALLAMDPHTGAIRALVGGYDYRQSEFNRATQAQRQIGSAFKPIIYATALADGVTHLDQVSDTPVTVRTAGGLWSPKNYDGDYLGTITLRTALAKSINTVAVRLILRVGVDAIIGTARKLGIRSPIPRHVSIALGTPDLTLLEVVAAYAAFVNGGRRIPPQDESPGALPGRFVEMVTTDDGTVVADYRERLPIEQVLPPELAYLVVDLMKAVVERGTGRRAQELGRPAAGKTGTSTDWRDAWFLGYTADLIAGVWVGRDDFKPIGARATGGSAALPIWLQFMQAAHPDTPVRDFDIPADITLVWANELTGEAAPPGSRSARLVPFARGTVPKRFSPSVNPTRFGNTERFDPGR